MSKSSIVVIVLALVIVAGAIYYFSVAPKSYVNNSLPAQEQNPATTANPEPITTEPLAPTTQPTVQIAEVVIKNFAFSPAELQVKAGAEVKWTNQDSVSHTIAGDNFQSEQLAKGQGYSRVFSEIGSFNYYCSIHPSMTGKITVIP